MTGYKLVRAVCAVVALLLPALPAGADNAPAPKDVTACIAALTPGVWSTCASPSLNSTRITKDQLAGFMSEHKFTSVHDFVGKSLPFFSTHHDLVERQRAAREAKEGKRAASNKDVETWKGDIAGETKGLVTN